MKGTATNKEREELGLPTINKDTFYNSYEYFFLVMKKFH